MTDRIQQALDAVRDALLARHRDAVERVQNIRAALDAYEAALEVDIAAEFAAKNGVAAATPRTAVRAALDVRAAIEALPELAISVARETASAPLPEPPASKPERRVPAPRDPDSLALEREADAIEWDALADNVFIKYAEELAARARAVQQRVGDASEYEGRLIRRLTAMVHERGVSGVYGLSLRHSGDWTSIARRAREERERLQAVGDAARPLGRKLLNADDVAKLSGREEEDDEPDAHDEPLELRWLAGASTLGSVVMVGGIVKNDKLERVRKRTGIDIEWVPIAPDQSGGATSLARRVRSGNVVGLVMLHGLMAHKDYEPLVDAARATSTPVVYADKAGKGALVRALVDLDGMLARTGSLTS